MLDEIILIAPVVSRVGDSTTSRSRRLRSTCLEKRFVLLPAMLCANASTGWRRREVARGDVNELLAPDDDEMMMITDAWSGASSAV